ncbi:hypothetical protein HYS97_03300 [Candidatus Daviesbacteria bacterium]|nr:hypothetical protein [Candidatus Daviesbacteria bacterium]
MDKIHYRCSGSCKAIITKEQYDKGLRVCGTKSCNMYKKPFEKVVEKKK